MENCSAPSSILDPRSSILNSRHRTAFSFAEVMFAVVILGIGFILIAAIFPVAIQQSQATGEESNAAAIARQAAVAVASLPTIIPNPIYMSSMPASAANTVVSQFLFPATVKPYVLGTAGNNAVVNGQAAVSVAVAPPAVVVPIVGSLWDLIKANTVLPSDPRYAYAAFYKRENNSNAAELIVLAMTVRNRSVYDPTLDEVYQPGPSTVSVSSTPSDFPMLPGNPPVAAPQTAICPDTVTVNGTGLEGSCLQISSIPTGNPTTPLGRSYLLGKSLGSSLYEMMPGYSMALTPGTSGLWGTPGRIADAPLANQTALLSPTNTLQATVAYAQLIWLPGTPAGKMYLTTYAGPGGANNPPPPAAVPGAFVIVADDYPFDPSGTRVQGSSSQADYYMQPNIPGYYAAGALNGRIFRLGKVSTEDGNVGIAFDPGTFDLDPQYGIRPPVMMPDKTLKSPDTIPNAYMLAEARGTFQFGKAGGGYAKVYIIGAGRTDPTTSGSSATYTGGAQDIGIFATYFQVQ